MDANTSIQPAKKGRKRAKPWSESVGKYGHKIRLFEDPNSGILYGEMRDVSRPGKYRCVSLRHRDRERARRWALQQVLSWIDGEEQIRTQLPTVSHIFGIYLSHQTPMKGAAEQKADERRAKMWTRNLGAHKDLSKLTPNEWQSFIDARSTGAIDADGELVSPENRVTVRTGTVAADLVFLLSVLNWAAKWRLDDGRYLMQENPARGYGLPEVRNPRRPIVTEDRFLKVRAAAERVTSVDFPKHKRVLVPTYLPELLDIANGTGRRISAILKLQAQDLLLNEGPHGSIRWPAATDKMKREWTVPMNAEVRAAIDRVLAARPSVGATYLFPSRDDPRKPVGIVVASAWLMRAEKLAGVEKQNGSLWHAYRRKWATERKFLPAADVAAAGGWSDQNTLLQIYQQADTQTMYRVVSEPSKLRERPAIG